MTKQEFESRITKPITDGDYAKVEMVYIFHPSIDCNKGKDEIAQLYNMFGMRVIIDMIPTAEKAKDLADQMRLARMNLKHLVEEYERLINEG
jgi:signal recognition particle GTPase